MKQIIISHRGNLSGSKSAYCGENHPRSIEAALLEGFNVEVDVWYDNNNFFLGHEQSEHKIHQEFLFNNKLWIHCKNIPALRELLKYQMINCFFHNEDDCTLTSHHFIWQFPKNIPLTNRSIAVMPERVGESWDISKAYGICTDFPENHKKA